MKPSRVLLTVTTLALALLFTVAIPTATAGKKDKEAVAPPEDARELIQSVDAATGVLVVDYKHNNTTHAYAVDGITKITVNNSPAKFADIKVGMQVRDCVERDSHALDSIAVSNADPAPVEPKKKKN